MQPAAELVAREGVSLREAATRLRIPLTNEQAANFWRTKSFQKLLRAERQRYYLEIASDPAHCRKAVVGKMLYLVDRLLDNNEPDKALEGLLKVARVEGWLAGEQSVNVFNSLSDQDLAALKQRALEKLQNKPLAS